MNYDIHYYKKNLIKPINDIVNEIVEIVQLLSPLKDDSYKRNIKYTIRDYAIGIIDVIKNFFSWIIFYPKIDKIYEKTIESYRGLLLLAISMIIYKRG